MAGLEIDGTEYPLPTLDDIDLDEERILYVWSDTVISDFMPAHPDADENVKQATALRHAMRIRNPDFKRALIHIAYRRAHPDVDDAEIQKLVGKVNAFAVDVEMLRGDDDRPPEMTSQKPPESKRSSNEPSESSSSGSPTENGSDQADATPAPTGTSESGTSSPLSLATPSAA